MSFSSPCVVGLTSRAPGKPSMFVSRMESCFDPRRGGGGRDANSGTLSFCSGCAGRRLVGLMSNTFVVIGVIGE